MPLRITSAAKPIHRKPKCLYTLMPTSTRVHPTPPRREGRRTGGWKCMCIRMSEGTLFACNYFCSFASICLNQDLWDLPDGPDNTMDALLSSFSYPLYLLQKSLFPQSLYYQGHQFIRRIPVQDIHTCLASHLITCTSCQYLNSRSSFKSHTSRFRQFLPRPFKNGVKKFTEWSVKQRTRPVLFYCPFMRWFKQLPMFIDTMFVVAQCSKLRAVFKQP